MARLVREQERVDRGEVGRRIVEPLDDHACIVVCICNA
jgi:hypothetical protein